MFLNVPQCSSKHEFAEAASRVPACQLSIFCDDDVFLLEEEDVDVSLHANYSGDDFYCLGRGVGVNSYDEEDGDEGKKEEPRPCMSIVQWLR